MSPRVEFYSNGGLEDRQAADIMIESKIPFISRGPDSEVYTPFVSYDSYIFVGVEGVREFIGTYQRSEPQNLNTPGEIAG